MKLIGRLTPNELEEKNSIDAWAIACNVQFKDLERRKVNIERRVRRLYRQIRLTKNLPISANLKIDGDKIYLKELIDENCQLD